MIIQAVASADGADAVISADAESSARTIGHNASIQSLSFNACFLRLTNCNAAIEDHHSGVPLWQTVVASRMLNVYTKEVLCRHCAWPSLVWRFPLS
jgi:hypothetical protein